jgi:hypothetical protein
LRSLAWTCTTLRRKAQLAQIADRARRHEPRTDQAVAQQVADPLAVLHVGLAPRHGFDVLGVGHDHLEVVLQRRIDRLPVDAGALHRDLADGGLQQPVPQRDEIVAHRAEAADLLVRAPATAGAVHAGHHRGLVHIETGAAVDDDLHGLPPVLAENFPKL